MAQAAETPPLWIQIKWFCIVVEYPLLGDSEHLGAGQQLWREHQELKLAITFNLYKQGLNV